MDSTSTSKKKQRRHLPMSRPKEAQDADKKKSKSPPQPKNKKRKSKSKTKEGKQSKANGPSSPKRAKKSSNGKSPSKHAPTTKDPAVAPPAAAATTTSRPHFTGVNYEPDYAKYEAKMFRGSQEYNLGLFDLACDAALAYDAACRITGSGTITSDVDEIKYALNWLDHAVVADAGQEEKSNGDTLNFTAPYQYREARQREQQGEEDCLNEKAHEEELKVRIKKEILNLAKAYVLTNQGVPREDEQGIMKNNDMGSDATSPSPSNDEKEEVKHRKKKKDKKTPLLKKKTWVPDYEAIATARVAEEAKDSARKEEAEALLALQKKRDNETKKEALAQKLESFMSGGGSSVSSAVSNPPQDDVNKSSAAASPFAAAAPMGGSSASASTFAIAASAGGECDKPAKSPEEEKIMQLKLNHQLMQQRQALNNLRAGSSGGIPLPGDGLSRLPNGLSNNPALDQLLALASQRPDMVNENVIRQAMQEQQAREAAALRAAQIQASLITAGLHGPLPLASSQFGSQQPAVAAAPAPVPSQQDAEKKPGESALDSSNVLPSKLTDPAKAEDENSVALLLASMGHKGSAPPSLVESLEAALKEQKHGQLQDNGNHEGRGGVEEGGDAMELMKKQLANEKKKAALAQKLSALMAGSSDGEEVTGQEVLVKNEKEGDNERPEAALLAMAKQNGTYYDNGQANPLGGDHHSDRDNHKLAQVQVRVKEEAKDTAAISESQMSTKSSSRMSWDTNKEENQPQERQGMVPENVASSAAASFQQQRLQAAHALQGLSGERLPEGIDEQTMLQSLMLKKQMDEMNKQALEQKVQDYIQGKGVPQPPPAPNSGLNGDLSRNLTLQSLLQEGGARQSLQQADMVRQAAIQTLLANQQRGQQPDPMGLGTNSALAGANFSDAVTHDVVHRHIVIESMLMSEENRLRQLREALQGQFVSHPTLNQMMGGGGFGGGGDQFATNPHHALMLEQSRAMIANDESRKAMLSAEITASAVEQRSQEMALRQALALRVSQGAAAAVEARASGPAADSGISHEMLLEAARNHGVDPQTMMQLFRR